MRRATEKPYPEQDVLVLDSCWVSMACPVAFVPVERLGGPGKRGATKLFAKVHASVVYVACPACGAAKGMCCISRHGYRTVSSHADRLVAWDNLKRGRPRRKAPAPALSHWCEEGGWGEYSRRGVCKRCGKRRPNG